MLNIVKEDDTILRVETIDFNTIHRISELDESLTKIHKQLEFMAAEILFLKQKQDLSRKQERRSCFNAQNALTVAGALVSFSISAFFMYGNYMESLHHMYYI